MMEIVRRTSIVSFLCFLISGNATADVTLKSHAFGNLPGEVLDLRTFTASEWAAAGSHGTTIAEVPGHPSDPPHSGSWARANFDQSDPINASLRSLSQIRSGYDTQFGANYIASEAGIEIISTFQIENLSGVELDIYFGSHVHGVFAAVGNGRVRASELTEIQGLGQFSSTYEHTADYPNVATGFWEGNTSQTTFHDPFYGEVSAYELGSFQIYGSLPFDVGETRFINSRIVFLLRTSFLSGGNTGLAMADFMSTANMTIRAIDPVTGFDRTNEIRVNVVPEPASVMAVTLGFVAILVRCRKQR